MVNQRKESISPANIDRKVFQESSLMRKENSDNNEISDEKETNESNDMVKKCPKYSDKLYGTGSQSNTKSKDSSLKVKKKISKCPKSYCQNKVYNEDNQDLVNTDRYQGMQFEGVGKSTDTSKNNKKLS